MGPIARRLLLSLGLAGVACEEAPPEPEPAALTAGPAAERAMVRALLDEIAEGHQPQMVSDEAIRGLWESRVEGQPMPARLGLEQMEPELRQELSERARLNALVELVSELERDRGVERNVAAIEELATLPIRFEDSL